MAHSDEDTLEGMEAEREERLVRAASFGGGGGCLRAGAARDTPTTRCAGSRATSRATSSTSAPGTGKLTRSLVALGHRVTAVEPLEEMLERLRRRRARRRPRCAAAQRRSRCRTAPQTSSRARRRSTGSITRLRSPRWPGCCGRDGPDRARLEHPRRLAGMGRGADRHGHRPKRVPRRAASIAATDRASTRAGSSGRSSGRRSPTCSSSGGRISSSSSAPGASARCCRKTERAPVLERVEALFDTHSRDGVLAMPYVTECFRAVRR